MFLLQVILCSLCAQSPPTYNHSHGADIWVTTSRTPEPVNDLVQFPV